MLPKFFATWLVVLVIAPFTAPFSTCDLTSLFGDTQGQHTPVAPPGSVALTTDAAVPSAPFVSAVGRAKLVPLPRVHLAESAISSSSDTWIWSVASARCLREHVALTTILRL